LEGNGNRHICPLLIRLNNVIIPLLQHDKHIDISMVSMVYTYMFLNFL